MRDHRIAKIMRSTSSKPSRKPSRRKSRSKPKNPALTSSQKRRFQQRLLKWYGEHGRDLPWRKTSDPYHILISEVMLQQTQVDRVIPRWQAWMQRWPAPEDLAAAPVADALRLWDRQIRSEPQRGRPGAGAARHGARSKAAPR